LKIFHLNYIAKGFNLNRFCTYCGSKESSTEIDEHMRECSKNPRSRAKKAEEKRIQVREDLNLKVINQVKSLDDIIPALTKVLFENGYDITFQSIPDIWSDKPYGNPYDVRFPNDEKVYAGWSGNWKGQIKPHKGYKKVTISDLHSTWSDSKFNFSFVRTESGSSGENFSISGHILVDDFPHLHKEYYLQGYNERFEKELKHNVRDLENQIKVERNDFINTDGIMIDIRDELSNMKRLYDKLNTLGIERQAELDSHFTANKKVELPEIECPYIDMSEYLKLKLEYTNKTEVIESPDLANRVKDLTDTIQRALKTAEDNLERFV